MTHIDKTGAFLRLSLAALLLIGSTSLQAASIYLTPASSSVPLSAGTTTLELFMDFSDVATTGGGIDLALSGPIANVGFAPSTYFTTVPDPGLTGFGTGLADADLEVHFGTFDFASGLSGVNKLGDITVDLLGLGTANIDIAINSFFGPFFDLQQPFGQQIDVQLIGAEIQVVPVPAAAWLFMSGLLTIAGLRRRASSRS